MKIRLGSAAGRMVSRTLSMACMRFWRNHARKSTRAGLAISDGWKEAGPKRIQRWVLCESRMRNADSSRMMVRPTTGKTTVGLLYFW